MGGGGWVWLILDYCPSLDGTQRTLTGHSLALHGECSHPPACPNPMIHSRSKSSSIAAVLLLPTPHLWGALGCHSWRGRASDRRGVK